ncbi:MAG: MBL fold metallo-hydrolase [Nevskia sp.]|nr:MBL fold metallo-hydrolase [Nevskia sp.]
MQALHIGDAVVHRIEEWSGLFLPPRQLFAGYDEAAYASARPQVGDDYIDPDSTAIKACLQSFVIETGGRTILLDTGAGNDKERPGIPLFGKLKTPFLQRLAAAGFAPGRIDTVVCTHLHVDHVGWNTILADGEWVPTFPNAQYVFPAADAMYWDPRNRSRFSAKVGEAVNEGFFDDSVRPILQRGLARLVDAPLQLFEGVRLDPAGGHTPGSQTLTLESAGERAIFVGDVLHHPLQIYNPDWNSIFCEDAQSARDSRRRTLGRVADERAVMIPAHFAGRHVARVERAGGGFLAVGL